MLVCYIGSWAMGWVRGDAGTGDAGEVCIWLLVSAVSMEQSHEQSAGSAFRPDFRQFTGDRLSMRTDEL